MLVVNKSLMNDDTIEEFGGQWGAESTRDIASNGCHARTRQKMKVPMKESDIEPLEVSFSHYLRAVSINVKMDSSSPPALSASPTVTMVCRNTSARNVPCNTRAAYVGASSPSKATSPGSTFSLPSSISFVK